jgi:hypothetical protein
MVGHDGNVLSIDMYATIEERLSKTKPIFTKWLNHIHDENRKKYYPPFQAKISQSTKPAKMAEQTKPSFTIPRPPAQRTLPR